MSVEVNNESGVDVDERALAELGRFVLDALRIDPLAELSVLLVDTDTMAALHQQWMDLPGPTDVMAFPMDAADGPAERFDPSAPPGTDEHAGEAMLGDVVLCPTVAADQATLGRALHRGRAAPALHARHPAPARLRPRRAGRGARDVRAAGPAGAGVGRG